MSLILLIACTTPSTVELYQSPKEGEVTESEAEEAMLPETILPADWRPQASVRLDCAWLSQQPSEDVSTTLNCGPTSLVMAAACIDGEVPEYTDVIEAITWMDEHVESYNGVGEDYRGSYTNTVQLTDTAQGLYNLPSERFYETLTLQGMYEDLESGVPVLVAVTSQTGNTTDVMQGGGGHFMLLVGMTSTHVVVHDPAPWDASLGEYREYTIESFLEEWQDAGVQFLTE